MTVRQTSAAAYHEIKSNGLLARTRFKVYSYLYNFGPKTGNEVDRDLGGPSWHKRLSELEALGVASRVGRRLCSVSGMECETWDVTPDLPIASNPLAPKKPTKAEANAALIELGDLHKALQARGGPGFSGNLIGVLAYIRKKYT